MAIPFYVPAASEDAASSSNGDGSSTSSSQSPNTTSSATQTPLQSPVNGEHLWMAFFEALYRCSINNVSPVFQYPPPPASPSCTVPSPSGQYAGGEVFFPRGRSTPRTPRTSISFWGGDEISFFRQHQSPSRPPQSAPPIPPSQHHHHQQHQHQHQQHLHPNQHNQQQHHHQYSQSYQLHSNQHPHYQFTPPPTPTATTTTGNSATIGTTTTRLHRSHSDVSRRPRLTSTGEDENECFSEHETSWDEYEDRYDNFTAGRDRLQEFNGRIPPRKKKKDVPKPKPKPKEQSFTWPTVVTVFVFAMGCGFLVAR